MAWARCSHASAPPFLGWCGSPAAEGRGVPSARGPIARRQPGRTPRCGGDLCCDADRSVAEPGCPPRDRQPGFPQHAAGHRASVGARPTGCRLRRWVAGPSGARRAKRRFPGGRRGPGNRRSCGTGLHLGYRRSRVPPGGGRGTPGRPAADRLHGGPAPRAAQHRCAADHRPAPAVRHLGSGLPGARTPGRRRTCRLAGVGRRRLRHRNGCAARPGAAQPGLSRAPGRHGWGTADRRPLEH